MMNTNARAITGHDAGYEQIGREERNVAAILYHALLDRSNLWAFLKLVGCSFSVDEEQLGIFFEYAYLRDLWSNYAYGDEAVSRRLITELLGPVSVDLDAMSIEDFNRHFGAGPRASTKYIQSPANWSIRRFCDRIADNETFLRVCRFKWAFNAKPDIVIHTSRDTAVCVEAKFESDEGSYPTSRVEKDEFARRGLARVKQTELQRYMLEELLGVRGHYVLLVDKAAARSATHRTVTWRQVFDVMDFSAAPRFVNRWVERFG